MAGGPFKPAFGLSGRIHLNSVILSVVNGLAFESIHGVERPRACLRNLSRIKAFSLGAPQSGPSGPRNRPTPALSP